jgi:hypothetical protein
MNDNTIENLYAKLDDHINLVESYSQINNISNLIKFCRLKPYLFMFENRLIRLRMFRKWYDEFGNSLVFNKDNSIEIIYNDLELNDKINPNTDIYCGLSIDKIIKFSKLSHCYYGKDEDLNEDFCLLTFLGIDNYFRTYLYSYGEWKPASPLLMGFENLVEVTNMIGIKKYCHFTMKKNILPCVKGKAWLSSVPVTEDLLQIINMECDYIAPFFKGK